MRVLLVEKDYHSGAAIKKVLEKNKYIVDLVTDGQKAWNKLNKDRIEYTVAIFDWVLPNLSGIELIKKLRKNNNSLPVLLLTIKNSLQDKVTGLDAGADDYLVKPFRMPELLARVEGVTKAIALYNTTTVEVRKFNFRLQYLYRIDS